MYSIGLNVSKSTLSVHIFYRFTQWSDGNTNPVRLIQIDADISINAEFSPI